jgi:predicted glycoside hydrolase/deacetylase ChbG (UPF0249 family)
MTGDKSRSMFGSLIINADDWGRDQITTDMILACVRRGTVSSASAMVFMEDSERSAGIARQESVDTGLHLNFTSPFTATAVPPELKEKQARIIRYLRGNRLASVLFHPGLKSCFEYVVRMQFDEYRRLYGIDPKRLDGHHHMHLCANVLLGGLLPSGTIVRRNFSFQPGEKSALNRGYRRVVDGILKRQHRMTDLFFSLPPLEPLSRVEKIFAMAKSSAVEVETHPVNPVEYQFLMSDEVLRVAGSQHIQRCFEFAVA